MWVFVMKYTIVYDRAKSHIWSDALLRPWDSCLRICSSKGHTGIDQPCNTGRGYAFLRSSGKMVPPETQKTEASRESWDALPWNAPSSEAPLCCVFTRPLAENNYRDRCRHLDQQPPADTRSCERCLCGHWADHSVPGKCHPRGRLLSQQHTWPPHATAQRCIKPAPASTPCVACYYILRDKGWARYHPCPCRASYLEHFANRTFETSLFYLLCAFSLGSEFSRSLGISPQFLYLMEIIWSMGNHYTQPFVLFHSVLQLFPKWLEIKQGSLIYREMKYRGLGIFFVLLFFFSFPCIFFSSSCISIFVHVSVPCRKHSKWLCVCMRERGSMRPAAGSRGPWSHPRVKAAQVAPIQLGCIRCPWTHLMFSV